MFLDNLSEELLFADNLSDDKINATMIIINFISIPRIIFLSAISSRLLCIEKFKGIGAGDEIRTHDINLGKVALYP